MGRILLGMWVHQWDHDHLSPIDWSRWCLCWAIQCTDPKPTYIWSYGAVQVRRDVLWHLPPIAVRPSSPLAHFKCSSTTPGSYFTLTAPSQKPWHIYSANPKQHSSPEVGAIPTAAPKDTDVLWQPAAEGQRFARTPREKQRALHSSQALRSACRQPLGTAHFSHNEL